MIDLLEIIVNAATGLTLGLFVGRHHDRNYNYGLELQPLLQEGVLHSEVHINITKEEVDARARKDAQYNFLTTASGVTLIHCFYEPLFSSTVKGVAVGSGIFLGTYLGIAASKFSRHRAKLSLKEKSVFEGYLRKMEELVQEGKADIEIKLVENEAAAYIHSFHLSKRNPSLMRELSSSIQNSMEYVKMYKNIDTLMHQEGITYLYYGEHFHDDADALLIHQDKLYHLPVKAEMGSMKQEKSRTRIDAHITGFTSHEIKWDRTIGGVIYVSRKLRREDRTLLWVKADDEAELTNIGESVLKNYLFQYSEEKGREYRDIKTVN